MPVQGSTLISDEEINRVLTALDREERENGEAGPNLQDMGNFMKSDENFWTKMSLQPGAIVQSFNFFIYFKYALKLRKTQKKYKKS